MSNLVIDIGNTLTKIALFNNRDILKIDSGNNPEPEFIERFVRTERIDNVILSSVKPADNVFESYLRNRFNFLKFSASVPVPVNNRYKNPQTLGLDRLAAVIGAAAVYPQTNCLVIDAGSCITYDFIDGGKNYFGGSISPGIDMRYKAMHTFTGKLPLLNFDPEFYAEQGEDTRTSMLSGVQKGVLYEVEGFIKSYTSRYPDVMIALCGGNADFFASQLKNSIFAHNIVTAPHLVLIGLNEVIHQHND